MKINRETVNNLSPKKNNKNHKIKNSITILKISKITSGVLVKFIILFRALLSVIIVCQITLVS